MFNLWRKCLMFFKGDAPLSVTVSRECTILHYHQQRVLISPSCHHLLTVFFVIAIFMSGRWYFTMLLIGVSLYLTMLLIGISLYLTMLLIGISLYVCFWSVSLQQLLMFSAFSCVYWSFVCCVWRKGFRAFPHFLKIGFSMYLLSCKNLAYTTHRFLIRYMIYNFFLPFFWLSSHFLGGVFEALLNFDEVHFICLCCYCCVCFWCHI